MNEVRHLFLVLVTTLTEKQHRTSDRQHEFSRSSKEIENFTEVFREIDVKLENLSLIAKPFVHRNVCRSNKYQLINDKTRQQNFPNL
jgi:hypothetical protein